MDVRVANAIAVDLTYVEVSFDFGNVRAFYSISGAPHTICRGCMLCESKSKCLNGSHGGSAVEIPRLPICSRKTAR